MNDKPKTKAKIVTCPNCLHQFPLGDSEQGKRRLMMKTLADAGFGLREVGRIFGEHPETIKYWQQNAPTQTNPEAKE